jgi:hypoxanthine phosphoribosyltransferase
MTTQVRVLYDAETLSERIRGLAEEIASRDHEKLLVIAVLRGSFVFAADLIRALHYAGMAPEIEFIQLSSYREAMVSSGQVDIVRDIDSDVHGRDVMLIDDILESGRTLAFAKDLLAARGARTVTTCVLLDKPEKRAVHIKADYVGFECPDLFVVGYGMDVAHSYRQLPFVGVIEHSSSKPSDDPGRV